MPLPSFFPRVPFLLAGLALALGMLVQKHKSSLVLDLFVPSNIGTSSSPAENQPNPIILPPDLLDSMLSHGHLRQEISSVTLSKEREAVLRVLSKTYDHMIELTDELQSNCKNVDKRCAFWASSGECDVNPSYMLKSCAPACQSCVFPSYSERCPKPEGLDDTAAFKLPGDLNGVFESIKNEANGIYKNLGVNVVSEDPWIITFDDFMSAEEVDALVSIYELVEFDRSTDVGPADFTGSFTKVQSSTRTSTNAWCTKELCADNPLIAAVISRMSEITTVPEVNSEHLQILRYEPGQFYRRHHDFIDAGASHDGPRVLTMLLYLSDVDEGGGTNFPKVKAGGTKIAPKKGKAVLWPNVLDAYPMRKDMRTLHEALDVVEGVKFAVNAWFHMFDFKTPNAVGCTS
jgi:prolyl 4-hydroxylase